MKILFITLSFLVVLGGVGLASPLADFSSGRVALDLAVQPHAFEGGDARAGGVTVGLGDGWAVGYRQQDYDSTVADCRYRTASWEVNLIRKLTPSLQLYAGLSRTQAAARGGGPALPARQAAQAGVILIRPLGGPGTVYAILGGGANVTDVEFGYSHRLSPAIELTATYRHLTVEKVGPARAKENFRGFGTGLTIKF